jgi:hypothetical protein
MDGQDFEELKTESLKLKTSKKSGAENRTPRRCRERCISLSQRERYSVVVSSVGVA